MQTIDKEFVKVPNWFFDTVLPAAPLSFSILLLVIFRNTVGWNTEEFSFVLADLAKEAASDKEATSRWLYVMQMVGWLWYRPASNDSNESTIKLRAWPDGRTARDIAQAVAKVNSQWSRRTRTLGFISLLRNQFPDWNFVEILDRHSPDAFVTYPPTVEALSAGRYVQPANNVLVCVADRRR